MAGAADCMIRAHMDDVTWREDRDTTLPNLGDDHAAQTAEEELLGGDQDTVMEQGAQARRPLGRTSLS